MKNENKHFFIAILFAQQISSFFFDHLFKKKRIKNHQMKRKDKQNK